MRRKQVRSTPVNSGPIVRSSIKKAKKQPEQSAALTPSRTPVARDNLGNVTWVPTGRNTTVRTPKVTNVQVTSPSTMESKFDLLENEEDMGVLSRVQSHHSSLSKKQIKHGSVHVLNVQQRKKQLLPLQKQNRK